MERRQTAGIRGLKLPEIEDHRRLLVSNNPEQLPRLIVTLDPTMDADHGLAVSVAFDIDAYCHFGVS